MKQPILWFLRLGIAVGLGYATTWAWMEYFIPPKEKTFLYTLKYLWLFPVSALFWLAMIVALTTSEKNKGDGSD